MGQPNVLRRLQLSNWAGALLEYREPRRHFQLKAMALVSPSPLIKRLLNASIWLSLWLAAKLPCYSRPIKSACPH